MSLPALVGLLCASVAHAGTSPRDAAPDWSWSDAEGDGTWPRVEMYDVDGDFVLDVLVHDPIVDPNDRSKDEPGRVLIFQGGNSLPSTPTWEIGLRNTPGFAPNMGVWGDIDGDHIADQVTWAGNPDAGTRQLAIRWGTVNGPSTTLELFDITHTPWDPLLMQALPVARIADLNNDGFGDLIVRSLEAGGVYNMASFAVHLGSETGFAQDAAWDIDLVDRLDNRWGGAHGGEVQIIDDIDLDGMPEVVFISWNEDEEDGAIHPSMTLFRGNETTGLRNAFWTSHFLFDHDLDGFNGIQVLGVGDMSFNGLPDTLVVVDGAPGDTWKVLLYKGSLDYAWSLDSPFLLWEGPSEEGVPRLLGSGDFDGDGTVDVALGRPGAAPPGSLGVGLIDLHLAGSGLQPVEELVQFASAAGDVGFGAFGAMSDLNRDGKADLLTGTTGDLGTGALGTLQLFAGYQDRDGDGFDDVLDDCDPGDAAVYPGAEEVWYDGVDQDCDGANDYDQDGDGSVLENDCDDLDPTVNYDAKEVWYDGVDQDCRGGSDYDQDGDGYEDPSGGGDDCDDLNAKVNPGVEEILDNGVDDDCLDGDASAIVPYEPGEGCGCATGSQGTPGALLVLLAGGLGLRRRRA